MSDNPKPNQILLKDVPDDVWETLIDHQAEIKKKRKKLEMNTLSLESIIYKFIRANKNLIID